LDLRNQTPKPFHWKASVVEILRKVKRLGVLHDTYGRRSPPPRWTVSNAISTSSTPHRAGGASVESGDRFFPAAKKYAHGHPPPQLPQTVYATSE
jgi:hypothetical protein